MCFSYTKKHASFCVAVFFCVYIYICILVVFKVGINVYDTMICVCDF